MSDPMQMPMPPPPTLQPFDPTRGKISCFTEHGLPDDPISAATDDALRDLLIDHYVEAFRRLPVEDMPDDVNLPDLIDRGGLCLGLLDPVTNIILNTISLIPNGFETNPSPTAPLRASSLTVPASHRRSERSRDSWHDIAWTSSECLLLFMQAYFGLLTQEQAGRYLVWARGDLAIAVMLVEHELYASRPALPDPRSGRTRNSLRFATMGDASPDHLVSTATAWLPQERLEMLAPILRQEGTRHRLNLLDIKTVLHVLRHQDDISAMTTTMPPSLEENVGPVVERTTNCADLGDGRIAYTDTTITIIQRAGDHITSLCRPRDMEDYTHVAPPVPGTTTKSYLDDSPCKSIRSINAHAGTCPYVRSLEMSLYGTIHVFYLRALGMLPTHAARHHVRGILLAGHCYGPMDPVSNIILNALWYDTIFPLPLADRGTQAHDILDTLTMLRAVSRSLGGLVALLLATSGNKLPLHEILKYLCYTQCDLADMLRPHLHRQRLDDIGSPSPFMAAATAARHPQASSVATFFSSLAPTKLDQLRSLMISATTDNTPLSHESLTQICNILTEETSAKMIPWRRRPPTLCKTALSVLARKREAYAQQQSIIRGRIEQLLQDYASRHPCEPKYELDFICGVAKTGHMDQCYHVNFMAATNKSAFKNRLFFAEFQLAYQVDPEPSICCPLPQPYDMGRCYYGPESARKIAYPDHSINYFSSDITHGGLDNTEDILDTDFMYFDSQRDVVLARDLEKTAKQEEVMQRSFTGRHTEWNRRAC